MFRFTQHRRLTITGIIVTPSLLLLLLITTHIVPLYSRASPVILATRTIPNADRPPLQISSDPYTNSNSQHQTELEPDTYAFGSTMVAAFQAGRFMDGGSSNIGWATSRDNGVTWKSGFLPGITQFTGGQFARASDPSVAFDAAHQTWIISSLAVVGSGSKLASPAIVVNLSTDGGLTWSKPLQVVNGGSTYYDKDWIVCDDSSASISYGHCYIEWDNDDKGGLILMSTSTDGGYTWGVAQTTLDKAHGLGGQPLVQPNGTVIVPISGYATSRMLAFTSTNGGISWNSTVTVAKITGSVLPTAEIDATGKVYLVWVDCQFEQSCSAKGGGADADVRSGSGREDDLVMSTSTDGINWSPVQVIPIDPLGSGIDHLVPGLGVDKKTSGSTAHLALAFYYHTTTCDSHCQYYVGFVSSTDGGTHWTKKIHLADPMSLSWLPQGRNKVGDYISTSFCNGLAFPVFSIATAPSSGRFNEAIYTITRGLSV
ncbi:MAG TPA: sialidase family protein [Ktedonobacteraceae bacterium]